MLDERELEVARRDPHARRLPRPCGLTVHTGLGCKFGCLYCYIYDMGFSRAP
ncbi:MAG: radical SAM protein, partial [Nitrososphaerota archaeon]